MAPRRILLFDNITAAASSGGVARYFRRLALGLSEQLGENLLVFSPEAGRFHRARQVRSLPTGFRGSGRLKLSWLNERWAARVARRWQADVVLSAYYGDLRARAAEVFPVYDLIHELFLRQLPDPAGRVQAFLAQKRRCLERAACLLAISHHTARDLVAHYPNLDPAKIAVTPLGVDAAFFQDDDQPDSGGRPYFLFVGRRDHYKNFSRLVQAFAQSGLAKAFELRVAVPGREGFTPGEAAGIEKHRLTRRVRLAPARDDAALRRLYRGAVALVHPSEYEGFGLALLEAMASGTLVVTSDCASMPEVAGEAALYFDPHRAESIAAGLRRAAGLSSEERRARVEAGRARARGFSWEGCIHATLQALSGLA